MNKLFLLIIFTLSTSLYAKELVLYPNEGMALKTINYLKDEYKIKSKFVFTEVEKQMIDLSYSSTHALKLNTSHERIKVLRNDTVLNSLVRKIEGNNTLEFHNNEYFQYQWGNRNTGKDIKVKLTDIDTTYLNAIKGEDINSISMPETNKKVRIAVIDSGIDLDHPELKNKVYRNDLECKSKEEYAKCLENEEDEKICHEKYAKIDNDQNGYPMDCQGWNIAAPINEHTNIQGNNDTQDLIGHGTFVSGIIAAEDNDFGIKGLLNNVEILPVKVSGSEETVKEENATDIFAKGILYALKNNVDIINLSVGWASNEDSLLVTEMIQKANEMGILVVVAGGNSAHSNITYPCSYHEVICVGSHNPDGKLSHFSNKGSTIDLLAPGMKILSTWPLNLRPIDFVRRHGYEYKDGTSFSAPYVAGSLGKLINLGFTAEEARVKILKGTRTNNKSALILNGNLDQKLAYRAGLTSFIYPYKKTPGLINWNKENKKIVIRLKNYISDTQNISVKLIPDNIKLSMTKEEYKFSSWKAGEVKDLEFFFKGPQNIDSDLSFKIKIKSAAEDKSYPTQAVAVTLIHEKVKRDDISTFQLKSKVDLSKVSFKVFENITPYKADDFLVVDTSKETVRLALMKRIKDSYRISKFVSTPLPEAYISHMARIDIDEDGEIEYVVFGFMQNEEDEWITKFFVFNQNFKPKKYEIVPGNEIDNKLTTVNDKIFWIKRSGRIVPAWISSGFIPEEDLPPLNPWEPAFVNEYMKRVYYLGENRIHTERILIDEIEYTPHRFFAQTREERSNFDVKVLFYTKDSFKKNYYVSSLDSISLSDEYMLSRYHDIQPLDGMMSNDNTNLLFSEFDTSDRSTRLSIFNKYDKNVLQDTFYYESIFDPIQMVFSQNSESSYFALTKYNLLLIQNGKNYLTESRNTDRLIQYKKVKGMDAIYLPGEHTPGFTSELITLKDDKLIRSTSHRFMPYNSCSEIGFHSSFWSLKNQIVFFCNQNRAVHFINL